MRCQRHSLQAGVQPVMQELAKAIILLNSEACLHLKKYVVSTALTGNWCAAGHAGTCQSPRARSLHLLCGEWSEGPWLHRCGKPRSPAHSTKT
eukprot:1161976-Pelagomonas_calceolata.AAC.6